MSRMASMQVLNNAFSNLNNAMAQIMQDKRLRNQLEYEQLKHQADMAFRRDEALRSQSNADRAYKQAQAQFKYQEAKDAQAQANWLADALEKRRQFDAMYGLNSQIHKDKIDAQNQDRKQKNEHFNMTNALEQAKAKNQSNYQQAVLDARNIATFIDLAHKYGAPIAMAYANSLSGNGNFNTLASGIQTAVQNQAQAQAQENRKVPLKSLQELVEAGFLSKADAESYISSAYPELMEARKTETNGRKVFSGK